MKKSIYQLNGRIWLEHDNERVLGPGRIELVERIQASGSIRQAALQMKMSYKQAWDLIHHINNHFDPPLVLSQRGGKGGGTAIVTEHGRQIIARYHELNTKFRAFLDTNKNLLP